MPGHHDAGNEYTSIEDAEKAALFAKEEGLAGTHKDIDYKVCFKWYSPFRKYKYSNADPSP